MSFIITTSSNTGGIIIPNGDVEVINGGTQTFQFLPDIGYTIDKLLIDGIEQEIVDSYTFENITSDHVIELIFEPLYYNITSSSINEGGTVYPLGDTNVQQGNSQAFNFFPNENYKVSKVLIDGIEVDNKSAYTFNNVVANHTIDVEFEYVPRIFEINVMYTAGGKLNPEKTIKVIEGTNEVFDIVPDDKYELEYLSIDGDNVEVVNNQYVFENISDNHSIFAKFKYIPSYYVINASCNEGGKITNIGDHSYIEYSTIEYIFTPEHKHRVKNVIVDNISYGSIEKYTFSDLSSNHTIDVEFEYVPEVFIIQTSCGENGILSQTGEIKVQEATTFNLNIQPDYGYKIKEILVDGQIVDKTNVVSIENIWENHTIDVSFEPKIIYTITSSCDDNCKIYPLGQVDVYEEDNQKFEISANSGYFIKSIKVDDVDIEFDILKTSYTFENILENHDIVVESEKIESQYFISSIASNHGNISPNGANSYKFGENVTYNFTPISGYKLNHVIVDGKKIKVNNNTYTFYNVRANHTITATFTPIVADVSADKINGLDLILNYDIYNRVEPSKIYLSKPKKHLLGVLNGVDEQSCNVTLKANNTFTLTFDVSRYVDGEESNYYNNIDVLMELYVSSIGWFKITQSPEINFDGNNERLTVTAESYEIELQQYDKVGFLVNKASEDSIEMMATDNTYLDENGYVLFRDNVLFHRDTSQIETLLDDFTSYNEEDQTIDNLKKLLVDNPFFLTSAWRFDIDIDAFMSNITEIKANLMGNGYDTDYLDEFQKLYNVKDSSTGESSLTTAIIKSYLVSNSELIEYIPFDINDQNVSVKNKIFNCSSENSNGDLSAVLNVENAYCIQGSEINFNIEVENNKGDLTYKYMFGEDEHCMTDYISQNSISWTSYYSIDNEQYISIPITVEVVDTYIDDENVKQTQTLKLTTYVYIFIDKDTLSEYLVENDIALTYEEYEKYSLVELIQMEIQRMKDLSLLDQILLECPSWTVGFVDKYIDEHNPNFLCDEVGSFEIDSQDVYSLLTQTLAQYFSCIFVFDTVDMTVNAYRIDGIGKDTNIHLGYRNIQNSVSVTPSDELYTVFNVSNGDTLNLAYVNFGDREIEDISYFLTEEYLDSELIKKYNMWQEYRESLRDEYIEYSKLYNEQNNVITELYNRVPVDGLDIEQYKSFSYNELDEELHNYIALIEGIKSCFKIVDNESQYETIVIVASEDYNITYEYDGLRENLEEIQKSIYWNEYKQYKQIVENILIAMNNFGMDEDDENYCDYIDDWQWDMITYGHMYGLDELKVKLEEFKNGLDVYKDYALPYEETDKSIIELNYNAKRDEYLKYKTSYDKCIIMLNEREIEVSIAESILNEYYTIRNDIAQNVSKVNWSNEEFPNGFSDEDLEKLGRLYKSTDYVNENIIYTSTSSTEDIVDKAYELYEDAIENLYANSHPRMTYSTSVDNLFAMVDYYNYVINDFSLYNFLRLSIRDDYQVKLRVIECSLNPMVYDNNLNIVFSNMVQYKSKRNDFASLLDNAISSAKNQISSLTKSSNSNANEFSFDYDMVKSLLNSKAFGSYMNSYTANTITPEALETALSNLDNISSNSAFIKYLNSNLLVTNEAYMDYLNSNLIVSDVADIRTLMFGSATGNILQSNFSNSVISLLGDATIKSAMIESLNASKINAGTINTNYVEIESDSGNMKISDNTIQIRDDNNVTRVQIGKDSSNDYNMYVLDENGKVMFDATGLHEDGIKNGIIRDDMVSDNANISGSKLNIQSLYSSMNDSGYSLNASNVKLDAENQSLEVSFNTLNSKVTQQGNSISSYGTKLNVLQGQIDSKIWKSDVETLVANSETLYNLNTQFSEFEQTLEGFETTVSQTNSRINDLGGMRNLILGSNDIKTSTYGEDIFTFETSLPIKPNTEYTFVLHGFANNSNLTNGGFALYFGNNLIEDKILCRTESETVIFTITSPSVITDEYHITLKNLPSETVLESKLEWICMYEGNASSVSDSWIPAPEDSAIMTTEAYSKATQTANDFSWLVSKDENTSEMTLTDEALKIISETIEFDGTVSFGTFDSVTQDILSSQIEANTNIILKLYDGDENPSYTPNTLILNAYKGYADDRVEYDGYFKVEEYIDDEWNVIFEENPIVNYNWDVVPSMETPYYFTQGIAFVYKNEIHHLFSNLHFKFKDSNWVQLDNLEYDISGLSSTIYNDEIYIMCDNYTKLHKYDGYNWTEVCTIPHEDVTGLKYIVNYNNEIHLLCGKLHCKWNGSIWIRLDDVPHNANNYNVVVYDNEIHTLGSDDASNSTNHYKWNGEVWSKLDDLPRGFYLNSTIIYNDEIHMLGGATSYPIESGTSFIEHYKYDGDNWHKLDNLLHPCLLSATVVYNNEIYIMGGAQGTNCETLCVKYTKTVEGNPISNLELNLSETINSSSNKLRCSIYSNNDIPVLIDTITLDVIDDFSSMLSVQNNKTYIDGGNVYCATLDADAILSNDIIFTGTITGGNVDGGGLIKSFNYEELETGVMLDLYNGYMSFGKKSSINDISKGVYFEETGQFYFGDDEHYIRYYQTNDGDYKLTISTDNITFGNGQTLETAIDIINSKNKNLIELNNIKTFIEHGGIIQDTKIGKSVSNYTINSNNRYNLIGFKIDHSVGLSTYTISGKTDLDQIKISLSCWNENSEPLEDYYSNLHSTVLNVNNDTFVYTFEVPEETSFFNIGIGDNEYELNGQNVMYSYNESSSTWTLIDSIFDDFKPYHYDGSCIVHNDLLYIIGGRNYSDSMFVFSLLNNKLVMEKKIPYPFINGSVVILNNEIHILGGEKSHYSHYKYNIEQDVFSEVSNIPYKFYKGSAVIFNNEIHILGGMISQTNHYKFDTSTSTWIKLLEIPYGFHGGEAVVVHDNIHLLGGTGYTGLHYRYYIVNNEEFYYDMGNMINSLYNGSAVVINDSEIHVLGDFSSGGYTHYKYFIDKYNIAASTWEVDEFLPCTGENGSAFVYNEQIYILGGYSDNSKNYTIENLQLEKGTEITDWKPSLIDMSNEKNSISSMVGIGYLSYVPLVDIQTMTSDCLVNDTNYYTYERDCINCVYQPEGQFYASFNHWCTQNKRYLLSCYDSNLHFIICELNYNDEILNISSPTIINENSTYVDVIEYEFTVSQEADQFYILIGHPFKNNFSIESVKLYAYESNINTNVNVVGNLNVSNEIYGNRLSIEYSGYSEDDLLGGTTALVIGSSINAYDKLEAYISTYSNYASLEISSDDRLTLKSNGALEIYTEDTMSIYAEYLNVSGCELFAINGNEVLNTSNYTSYCAKASHTHTISNITNLQATLDGKANTHSHPYLSTSGGTVSGVLTITGATYPNGGIYLPNAKYIYANNTSGVAKSILGISGSNNIFLGYSEYSGVGNTNIYGNTIKLNANTDVSISGYLSSQFNMGTDKASDGKRYYINDNATGRFNLLRYTSSQAISSRRYKNNIDYKDADYWHEALMQIKPCSFYYKNDDETKHLGLIAEDLIELIPELVDTDEEGKPASIEYANLTIPLIGEVQSLNNVVDEQKEEIDSLKDELQQLKELVAKLVS